MLEHRLNFLLEHDRAHHYIQSILKCGTLTDLGNWEQIYAGFLVSIMTMLSSTDLRYSEHYTSCEQHGFSYHDCPTALGFHILKWTECLDSLWDMVLAVEHA